MLLPPHPRAGHQYCAREAASPPPPHHPLPTHHPIPELQDGPTAPIGAGTRGVGDVLGEAKPVVTSRLVQQENCSGLKLGDRLAFGGLGKASTEGKRAFSPRFGLSELLAGDQLGKKNQTKQQTPTQSQERGRCRCCQLCPALPVALGKPPHPWVPLVHSACSGWKLTVTI